MAYRRHKQVSQQPRVLQIVRSIDQRTIEIYKIVPTKFNLALHIYTYIYIFSTIYHPKIMHPTHARCCVFAKKKSIVLKISHTCSFVTTASGSEEKGFKKRRMKEITQVTNGFDSFFWGGSNSKIQVS